MRFFGRVATRLWRFLHSNVLAVVLTVGLGIGLAGGSVAGACDCRDPGTPAEPCMMAARPDCCRPALRDLPDHPSACRVFAANACTLHRDPVVTPAKTFGPVVKPGVPEVFPADGGDARVGLPRDCSFREAETLLARRVSLLL